ncbi:hypothetical protein EIM50_20280 [Pseudoxanthomonas sp. SGD-10]|nr:hypothetical protein EIM50_20280 [Pseudoxanthomonas sp. SGD-10]
MKNYVLLLSFLILLSCGNIKRFKDQSTNDRLKIDKEEYMPLKGYNGDTMAYVQENFIHNKGNYIGKEIDILIGKLEPPVVKYYLGIHSFIKHRTLSERVS